MKKKLLIAAVVMSIVFAILFVINQPTRGRVTPITTQTKATKNDASKWEIAREKAIEQTKLSSDKAVGIIGSSTYTGKQFSLSYPNTYTIQRQEASVSGALEKVILLDSGSTAEKIVATATQMPDISSIDEVSAVQMRRLNPTRYTERSASASGTLGLRFDKNENGYEAIFFFLNKQILYTLALTAPSTDPKLNNVFESILTSFKLKEQY